MDTHPSTEEFNKYLTLIPLLKTGPTKSTVKHLLTELAPVSALVLLEETCLWLETNCTSFGQFPDNTFPSLLYPSVWHDTYHLKLALSIASFARQHFSLGQAVTKHPLDRRSPGDLRNSKTKC